MPATTGMQDATQLRAAGREALGRGDWEEARRRFERALAQGSDPETLEGLASACSMLADGNAAIGAREQAYALYVERGDVRAAARAAVWLAIDTLDFRYEGAIANGWIQRASRLLEDAEPGPEHGLVRLLEGHLALMADNDLETARSRAAEGLAIGRATGSRELEILAIGLDGLARVSEGDVPSGMRLLDEAAVAALGGEIKDPVLVGQSCCYLIHACERVRDFERAGQWCLRMHDFCERWHYATMFTVCRTQYASVLMHRGDWPGAERELLAAVDELRATRPAAAAPGIVRLAELRRRQGRREEASELFESVRTHRMAMLGRAELALDAGDAATARDLAEQFLRRIPRAGRTERVAGLDLLARASAVSGDETRLEEAALELEEIAGAIPTEPLQGIALHARGRALGRRDPERARRALEDAADLFERASMPFEAAHARLALAWVLNALDRRDAARRECELAKDGFQRLGATGGVAACGALAATIASDRSLRETSGDRREESPLTAREIEVLRLVAAGLSDKEIAARLHLSQHTIHRHASNILSKLNLPSRAAAVAYATRLGLLGGLP